MNSKDLLLLAETTVKGWATVTEMCEVAGPIDGSRKVALLLTLGQLSRDTGGLYDALAEYIDGLEKGHE